VRNHVTLCSQIGTQILILAKSFQSGRVPNFGTNVPKNERSVTLRSKIGAQILILAKSFQSGRAPSNGANAPKNERSVTTCDFTEELSGVIWKRFPDKPLSRIMNLSATINKSQKIGVESIKRRKTSGGATAAIEWKTSSD